MFLLSTVTQSAKAGRRSEPGLLAIFREHRHNWRQIYLLAKTDLKKMYKGAFLGAGWAVVKPLFTLFIYWFAFEYGIRPGSLINGYPRFLFMIPAFAAWFFMSDAILLGSQCIRKNKQYVIKMHFPVSNIMSFTLFSRLLVHFILTGIMYVYLICTGYGFSVYNLQFFLYCPLMFLFFLGLSWALAPMAAFSRDFENLIKSIMTGLFWLSGIMYDPYDVPVTWIRYLMRLNPINYFANAYREAFLYHKWFWEDPKGLLIIAVELVVVVAYGSHKYKQLRKILPDVL